MFSEFEWTKYISIFKNFSIFRTIEKLLSAIKITSWNNLTKTKCILISVYNPRFLFYWIWTVYVNQSPRILSAVLWFHHVASKYRNIISRIFLGRLARSIKMYSASSFKKIRDFAEKYRLFDVTQYWKTCF